MARKLDVRLCMKFILLAISKCRAKETAKHNATKNVVLGGVKVEMVDVKRYCCRCR